jgi:ABC-type dipeptide/oligopeptide/nickel transport system permease subunit
VTGRARFFASRASRVGASIVLFLVLFAVVGPLVAPHDAYTSDFVNGATPEHTPIGPSHLFWLGADRIYRDEFTRVAVGGRFSLAVGVGATLLATTIGALVGLVAGWFEGTAVDVVLMRAVDIGLALPFLLLVMAAGAALDRTTPATVVIILGLTGWLGTARVVRAKTMQVRALDFVAAARAVGRSTAGILWRHVLPNVAGLVVALATLTVAQMIMAESVLGYLGVGIAPPQPTWGRMVMEGQDLLAAGPWMVFAPASAIVLAVVGFNLLGEGLRDALDPRA